MRAKPKVGDMVFVSKANYCRKGGPLEPEVVIKVGRKYFTVDDIRFHPSMFHLDTGWLKSDFATGTKAYSDELEHAEELEVGEIVKRILDVSRYGMDKLPLETLRKIEALIQGGKSDAG